jgi:hypothetical protein
MDATFDIPGVGLVVADLPSGAGILDGNFRQFTDILLQHTELLVGVDNEERITGPDFDHEIFVSAHGVLLRLEFDAFVLDLLATLQVLRLEGTLGVLDSLGPCLHNEGGLRDTVRAFEANRLLIDLVPFIGEDQGGLFVGLLLRINGAELHIHGLFSLGC